MREFHGLEFHGLGFHGGQVDTAALAYPNAPTPWLDLSTGLNPVPWPVPNNIEYNLQALPSPAKLLALEEAAAAAFGLRTGAITALPGVEIGLHLLATIDLPTPIRHVAPAYGSYLRAFPGSRAITAGALGAEAVLGGTIILGNPNNPDGITHDPAMLIAVARQIADRGGCLIIDEAFADVDPAMGILPHLGGGEPVLVFRSFGKFFGLAGVRLGFACGNGVLVDRLRARIGSWPVSGAALTIGTAAYRDHGWVEATREDLRTRSQRLDRLLALHGLTATGNCPLFRLIEHEGAAALFDRLARAGVLTRPFGYQPRWLRFGLPGDDTAFDRLDQALANG